MFATWIVCRLQTQNSVTESRSCKWNFFLVYNNSNSVWMCVTFKCIAYEMQREIRRPERRFCGLIDTMLHHHTDNQCVQCSLLIRIINESSFILISSIHSILHAFLSHRGHFLRRNFISAHDPKSLKFSMKSCFAKDRTVTVIITTFILRRSGWR